MLLVQARFSIQYISHRFGISQVSAPIFERMLFITYSSNKDWLGVFVDDTKASITGVQETDWWEEERPQYEFWWHAPLRKKSLLTLTPDRKIEQLSSCSLHSFALMGSSRVTVTAKNTELLRHTDRLVIHRPEGWALKALEEMSQCGNRNAEYTLQRAFG